MRESKKEYPSIHYDRHEQELMVVRGVPNDGDDSIPFTLEPLKIERGQSRGYSYWLHVWVVFASNYHMKATNLIIIID